MLFQITLWIEHVGNKRLREPVRVGNSLSKAETYKTHFEASFYNSAKVIPHEGDQFVFTKSSVFNICVVKIIIELLTAGHY